MMKEEELLCPKAVGEKQKPRKPRKRRIQFNR
jgi:hypothetical protein